MLLGGLDSQRVNHTRSLCDGTLSLICGYGVQWLAFLLAKQRVRVQIPLATPIWGMGLQGVVT